MEKERVAQLGKMSLNRPRDETAEMSKKCDFCLLLANVLIYARHMDTIGAKLGRYTKEKGVTNMEKEYVEALEELSLEDLLRLRAYLDALLREEGRPAKDRYTGAPAGAHPETDDHNPG